MQTHLKRGLRLPVRTGVLVAAGLILVLVLAIMTARSPKPQVGAPAGSQGGPPPLWARLDITLGAQSISPQTLSVPSGVPVGFTVTNQGDTCLFHLGSYLGTLMIPPGQTVALTAVLPPLATSADGVAPDLTTGCLAQDQRQGRLALVAPSPGASPAGKAPQPAAGERELSITVSDAGVSPADVDLHAKSPVRLVLTNKGQNCLFYFGNYLRGLALPLHGTAEIAFTPLPLGAAQPVPTPVASGQNVAPAGESASASPPAGMTMGCLGDPQRQGRVNLS